MLRTTSFADPADDHVFFMQPVFRDEERNRLSDSLVRPVAEYPFGARIPARDNAVERFTPDRVIRTLEDHREFGICLGCCAYLRTLLPVHTPPTPKRGVEGKSA